MTDVAALTKKIDRLLERNNGTEPHIFDDDEVKELERLIALRKRLNDLGAGSDDALIDAVIFTLRLRTLGWFGRIILWGMAMCAALISQWDKIVEWWQ